MQRIVLTLLSLELISAILFTLDYLDHKKYSDGDDATTYKYLIASITVRGLHVFLFFMLIVATFGFDKDKIFLLLISSGVLFIFYMNMYNLISFPQRAVMIKSSDVEGVSDKLPYKFYLIHPSMWFRSLRQDNVYVYSLTSERSVVMRFAEEEAYAFTKEFEHKKKDDCRCCGKDDCPVTRVRGQQVGYTGYNISSVEYGETSFGVASTINVNLCEECWSNYKKLLINSDLVDEAELLTDLI
jgi:hypothetical protein